MAKSRLQKGQMVCNNPYCYRILIPFVVSLFPQSENASVFKIITYVGIYATCFALFYFLKRLKFNNLYAFIGVNLYLFSRFGPKLLIFDNYRPEAWSLFFILLCFIALLNKNIWLFVISYILGILIKEQGIIMLLIYYVYNARKLFDKSQIWKTIRAGVIPILVFIGIRLYYPSINPYYPFKYFLTQRVIVEKGLGIFLAVAQVWPICLLVMILNLKTAFLFLNKNKYFAVYLLFQIFILLCAGNDMERFALYLMPVFIPLTLIVLKEYIARDKYFLLVILLIQLYISRLTVYFTLDGRANLSNEIAYLQNFSFFMTRSSFYTKVINIVLVYVAATLMLGITALIIRRKLLK